MYLRLPFLPVFPFAIGIGAIALVPSASARITRHVVDTYPVSAVGTLHLRTFSGGIEIETADVQEVRIDMTEKIDASSDAEADKKLQYLTLDKDHSGSDVSLTAKYDDDHRGWFSRTPVELEFHVKVPRSYNVDLGTAGGPIKVGDLHGNIEARTSGGGLHFGNIQGDVDGHTSGGPIKVDGCTGKLDLHTSGGGIDLGRIDGPADVHTSGGGISGDAIGASLQAHTSGGSIDITFVRAPTGDCSLGTSGGGIEVTLPKGTACNLDAATSAGSVRSDFDVATTLRSSDGKRDRSRLSGAINGGGPAVRLRSSAGGIRVYEGKAPQPQPQPASTDVESR